MVVKSCVIQRGIRQKCDPSSRPEGKGLHAGSPKTGKRSHFALMRGATKDYSGFMRTLVSGLRRNDSTMGCRGLVADSQQARSRDLACKGWACRVLPCKIER